MCVLVAVGVAGLALPAPASAAEVPLRIADERINELVQLIDSDPGTFGGVSVDDATGVLTIKYPARAGVEAARARLGTVRMPAAARDTGSVRAWRVAFAPVRYSYAELEAVRQKVMADTEWQRLVRPVLARWYVDTERNTVVVGLTTVTPALRAEAARRFGGMVELQAKQRPRPQSRIDDVEPYIGGIRLEYSANNCTSGFVIRQATNPDVKRMLSAGHCGAVGTAVTNSSELVGTVLARQVGGKDVLYIGGRNYRAMTYVGPVIGPEDTRDVKGLLLPVVTFGYCVSGSFSGERCGRVTQNNVCVRYPDGTDICSLSEMVSFDGAPLTVGGDSGAPVYTYRFGQVVMTGMHVAGGLAGESFFHPYNVLVPAGFQVDLM
jgi:hypothetical protein